MNTDHETSSITTARGAIEWIATKILEREIPGLDMGFDVDFNLWTAAGESGHFRASWKGLVAPDFDDVVIYVEPTHHHEGHVEIVVMVQFHEGHWFPGSAVEMAKLYLAVAELAKEIADPWDDKPLSIG